jgi:hypothetical protein
MDGEEIEDAQSLGLDPGSSNCKYQSVFIKTRCKQTREKYEAVQEEFRVMFGLR